MPPLPAEHRHVRAVIDALVPVLESVNDHRPAGRKPLKVYPFRPRMISGNLPAIWTWLPTAPQVLRDQALHEEQFNWSVYIGVERGPDVEETAAWIDYVDAARYVLDRVLWRNQPLDDTVTMARRLGFAPSVEAFASAKGSSSSEIEVLGAEFPLQLTVDRIIGPNTNP